MNSQSRGYGERLPGRIRNATRTKPPLKSIWKAGKSLPHLFTEISPQIPKQYEHHFTVYGAPCREYTVEGQEPVKQTVPPPMFPEAVFLA